MPLPPLRNPIVHGAPAFSSKSKSNTNTYSSSSDSSSKDWSGDDEEMGRARTVNIPEHAMPEGDTNAADAEEYKCLIVEEIPPPGNDT